MNFTKTCIKCKKELDTSHFYKDRAKKDGLQSYCKNCTKQYSKQYHINNTKAISKQKKQYQKNNTEKIAKQRKQYYKNNSKKIAQYRRDNALFETYGYQLEVFEEVRCCSEDNKLLKVKCAYCGQWLKPTNHQVQNRLQVFNGITKGECRFYCSENCKKTCPIYNQSKYPKDFKKATSREVVPLLRQLVLERDDYTCQKCGATTETAQLHVHHEKSYTLNKIMANDPDNCITLCKDCHKFIHSQNGCKYIDLKC